MMMNKNNHSTIKANAYPMLRVLLWYALSGGVIGGFVLLLGVVLYNIIIQDKFFPLTLDSMLEAIPLFAIFGLIPALLTGIYCAINKLKITFLISWLYLFFIGGIFSAAYTLVFTQPYLKIPLVFILIGGISAVLVGVIALPQHRNG